MRSALSRRQALAGIGGVIAAGFMRRWGRAGDAAANIPRYRIAACDWMMLKRQALGAITRARECGCDGVETDMGPLSKNPTFASKLVDPRFREEYLASCKANGIEISSLAMSGFYAQSFPEREVERPIIDCLEQARLMGVKVAFLPLGVHGDLVRRPVLWPVIVQRLQQVAPRAEERGVTLGIETALDAAGDVRLLEAVGSPAVKIYYNFANAWQNDRDIHAELRTLGKDRICQIHCTNQDGYHLEKDPKVDLPAVRRTLDDLGWRGWLVIERSRQADRGRDVVYNFSANARYLKSVFQT